MHKGILHFLPASGEPFQESHWIDTPAAADALRMLEQVATARVQFLASSVVLTKLAVPGCPSKEIDWKGRVATSRCVPWEVLKLRYQNDGRWVVKCLGGVPREIIDTQLGMMNGRGLCLLRLYEKILGECRCMIRKQDEQDVVVKEVQGTGLATRKRIKRMKVDL